MGGPAPIALLLALGLSSALVAAAESDSNTRAGWKDLSLLNPAPAQSAFAAALVTNPADREAQLGEALARLQARSRTPANIAAAAATCEKLRRENSNDEIGIAATYYLARIAQVHAFEPDLAAAAADYRALLAAHPAHFYSQLGAPKFAAILLYADVSADEWDHRANEIAALIPKLTLPEAIRDTRLTLATALIRLRRDHARAYPLIAACLTDGSVTRMKHFNGLLLQAAESAHQLGRTTDESAWYLRFLTEFPHDSKAEEIRRRVKAAAP